MKLQQPKLAKMQYPKYMIILNKHAQEKNNNKLFQIMLIKMPCNKKKNFQTILNKWKKFRAIYKYKFRMKLKKLMLIQRDHIWKMHLKEIIYKALCK